MDNKDESLNSDRIVKRNETKVDDNDEKSKVENNNGTKRESDGEKKIEYNTPLDAYKEKLHRGIRISIDNESSAGNVTGVDNSHIVNNYNYYYDQSSFHAAHHTEKQQDSYDLQDSTKLIQLVREREIGRHFQCACLIALLETVRIDDILWMSERLATALPEIDKDPKRKTKQQNEQLLDMDGLLTTIYAQRGTVEAQHSVTGSTIISIARFIEYKSTEDVLRNIWQQYPQFRQALIGWTLDLALDTSADIQRHLRNVSSLAKTVDILTSDRSLFGKCLKALMRIIMIDTNDANRYIFSTLLNDPSKILVFIALLVRLQIDNQTSALAESWINECTSRWSPWRWKVVISLYAMEVDGMYRSIVPRMLHKLLKTLLDEIEGKGESVTPIDDAVSYIGSLSVSSSIIRNLLCNEFRDFFASAQTNKKRDTVIVLFFMIILESFGKMHVKSSQLPFVILDKREQFGVLADLYKYIVSSDTSWDLFRQLLEEYMEEYKDMLQGNKRFLYFFASLVQERNSYNEKRFVLRRIEMILGSASMKDNLAALYVAQELIKTLNLT